jgi:hypothetical protein
LKRRTGHEDENAGIRELFGLDNMDFDQFLRAMTSDRQGSRLETLAVISKLARDASLEVTKKRMIEHGFQKYVKDWDPAWG